MIYGVNDDAKDIFESYLERALTISEFSEKKHHLDAHRTELVKGYIRQHTFKSDLLSSFFTRNFIVLLNEQPKASVGTFAYCKPCYLSNSIDHPIKTDFNTYFTDHKNTQIAVSLTAENNIVDIYFPSAKWKHMGTNILGNDKFRVEPYVNE
jgi:hypothetical protein